VRRLIVVALLAAGVVFGAAGEAAAAEVEVADLLADQGAFDGSEVTLRGELVGDYGRRGDWVWVQVNGDAYADEPLLLGGALAGGNLGVAARIPADLFSAARFEDAGGYRHRGPLVLLTGTWRFHDPDRTGESYLDVDVVEVVAPELPLDEGPSWVPLGIGFGLLAVTAGFRLRRRGMAGHGAT
jgi:hypothetical protein